MNDIDKIKQIDLLINKSTLQNLTDEEVLQLKLWLNESDDNRQYYERVKAIITLDKMMTNVAIDNDGKAELLSKIRKNSSSGRKLLIRSIASVAAAILVSFCIFQFVNISDTREDVMIKGSLISSSGITVMKNNKTVNLTAINNSNHSLSHDEDKKEININKVSNVEKTDDEIVVIVDRGFTYKVTLPDSTKVWLNSESKLTYRNFSSATREVELDGEAYFDVSKDEKRPFIVKLNHERNVKVLGTSFNIKSYISDENLKVSLIKGSVRVFNKSDSLLLSPNNELIINNISGAFEIVPIMGNSSTAWINGGFVFYDEPFGTIATELSRRFNKKFRIVDSSLDEERLTIVLDTCTIVDLIMYIKRAGANLFDIEVSDNEVLIRDIRKK